MEASLQPGLSTRIEAFREKAVSVGVVLLNDDDDLAFLLEVLEGSERGDPHDSVRCPLCNPQARRRPSPERSLSIANQHGRMSRQFHRTRRMTTLR
jgi:hypothetical protein